MKTIFKLTLNILLGLQIGICLGQTPPEPPKTESSSSSHSISKTHSSDSDKHYSSSSISVKNNTTSYKFRASFDNDKTITLENYLTAKFSKNSKITNLKNNNWVYQNRNDEYFYCKLSKGQLKMYVNKHKTSKTFQDLIEAIGEKLSELITNANNKKTTQEKIAIAHKKMTQAKKNYEDALKKYRELSEENN